MRREISLDEISDGKLYGIHDMVKADCKDCHGCSSCCRGMGTSIVLDPLDIWNLKMNLGMTFEDLMKEHIELNVVDHIILPNLRMNSSTRKQKAYLNKQQIESEAGEEQCNFLDENGRCSVHAFRPGICRIFPLGRVYENRDFQYFLQVNECEKRTRTKVKVSKWIDCKQVKDNQKFIADWHYLLKDIEQMIIESKEEDILKQVSMYLINQFYNQTLLQEAEFYEVMNSKIVHVREGLGI